MNKITNKDIAKADDIVQSRQYPHMYYIRYASSGGRSYEYYNKTRATYYSILTNGTSVKAEVTGELKYQGFSKKRKKA